MCNGWSAMGEMLTVNDWMNVKSRLIPEQSPSAPKGRGSKRVRVGLERSKGRQVAPLLAFFATGGCMGPSHPQRPILVSKEN
jgi:hypothetical protein